MMQDQLPTLDISVAFFHNLMLYYVITDGTVIQDNLLKQGCL